MDAKFDSEGSLVCPDCDVGCHHSSARGRDTETIGGFSVDYYDCPRCACNWEVVDGARVYHSEPPF